MFLFRMMKRLVFFVLFVFGVVWLARFPYQGKPLYRHGLDLVSSGTYKEGVKDLKLFVGGLLKTVGEEIQETVTEEERKNLNKVIEKEAAKPLGKAASERGGQ